jgi:DNA-binding GntR family transcriptional regulator
MIQEIKSKSTSHTLSIRDYILSLIESKALNHQSKLPAERALCERFSISRITLRQALLQLETEGLIYRQHHKGWFVSPPRIIYDPAKNMSFTEYVIKQNREVHNQILSAEKLPATEWMRQSLAMKDHEEEVYVVRRLRSVDRRAVMLEHLYINGTRCQGLLDHPIEQSVSNVLKDHYGLTITRSEVHLHSTALTEAQAADLNVAPGTPAIYVIRTNYDERGEIAIVDQEFWRHDALEITTSSRATEATAGPETASLSAGLQTLVQEYSSLASRHAQQLSELLSEQAKTRTDLKRAEEQIAALQQRITGLEQPR